MLAIIVSPDLVAVIGDETREVESNCDDRGGVEGGKGDESNWANA